MSQGRTILAILQKRVDALHALKESLTHQQTALLENRPDLLDGINARQVELMEAIQEVELEWAKIKKQLQGKPPLPSVDPDFAFLQHLDDDELLHFEQLKTQLLALGEEIQRLKENNQALIENSLGFVRAVLRTLDTGLNKEAVYRPGKRPRQRHLVVDRTL